MPAPTGDLPISTTLVGFRVLIPDNDWLIQLFQGAIATLIYPSDFEQVGTCTPEEAAEIFEEIVLNSFVPYPDEIGAIKPYATEFAPYGTLPCDGSSHLRIDYPRLYANINPVFIVDADTFKTPDLRGRNIIGTGQGSGLSDRAIGDELGEENHTLTIAELAAHDHSYDQPITSPALEGAGVPLPTGLTVFPSLTGSTGGDMPHNNMQPSLALNFFIVAI